jgi:hypothetical protein
MIKGPADLTGPLPANSFVAKFVQHINFSPIKKNSDSREMGTTD